MAELIIKDKDGCRAFGMDEGKPLFAGRTVECDLYLPSPGVSRKHAIFLARKGVCGLKDLDSSNGTFLNGRRLTHSVRLKDGDVIQIGNYCIEFRAPEMIGKVAPDSESESHARPKRTSARSLPAMEPDPARSRREKPNAAAPAATPIVPARPADAVCEESETFQLDGIPADCSDTPESDTPNFEHGPETSPAPTVKPSAPVRIAPPPAQLVLPEREEISDDEVGDGRDDAAFLIEEEKVEDEAQGAAALTRAAAEAGIVGEFAPDTEDEAPAQPDEVRVRSNTGPIAHLHSIIQPGADPAAGGLPLDDRLRQAVEARLCLYSFLADLQQERAAFLARRPKMADAVKSELARQDRELDKIPNAQQAESMIEKRKAKKAALLEKIAEAKKNDLPPPPKPSRDMREAEEIAISQWTICAQSFSEALPAAFAEAYRFAEDEPLTRYLVNTGVDPVPLMGGAVYYLALETLQEESRAGRQQLRELIAQLPPPSEKNGGSGMLGRFGRSARQEDGENDGSGTEQVDVEELAANEKHLADRMNWIKQELAFMERTLIQEFWKAYSGAALHYIPRHETMPPPVRAFLRHGAIGFKSWWMSKEVKDHIIEDCRDDVIHHMRVGKNNTNILYVDEYLAAVMNWECTPALDENLELNERNSPNWKADKALRKLINSRSQVLLMEELVDTLAARVDGLEAEAAGIDQQIDKLLPGSKNYKTTKSELGQKRQTLRVEVSKISKLAAKIKDETLANLKETIAETNARFDSGELPKPTGEFLIKRECDAIHKIGRLLANLKERFQPLVLRDNFQIGTDALNDRVSINGEILEMERRDPGIFLENLVPSKKKAARVDLRISPVAVLIPAAGVLAYSWNPRGRPEDGRLAIPTCFVRRRIRERQITYLLADFRWDTSKAAAGMDVMTSDTIVAAFMTVRWDWRKRSKEGREKGLIYTEQNDRTNWRRVYEAYSQTAYDSGKKLFNRNYDFYERIIGKYFDLPENVPLLKK